MIRLVADANLSHYFVAACLRLDRKNANRPPRQLDGW